MVNIMISSKNMRGEWGKRPPNSFVVDVTSAQGKGSKFRRDFSPMSPVEGGYKGYWCFENYWQGGKIWKKNGTINQAEIDRWWRQQEKGKRRCPKTKGLEVSHAIYNGLNYDYIPARKEVYVQEYYNLVKDSESMKNLLARINSNDDLGKKTIVVYDFDGPRKDDGGVDCLPVTLPMLQEKINDPKFPFGHGYVIAALLAGFVPEDYVQ